MKFKFKEHIVTFIENPIGYILALVYMLVEFIADYHYEITSLIEKFVTSCLYRRNNLIFNIMSAILQHLIIGGILWWIWI